VTRIAHLGLAAALLGPAVVAAQNPKTQPRTHTPQPTSAAITPADLKTRLYIFAADSMEGRETGTRGHIKATNYIDAELKKLGLKPMGDDGTFFQTVPVIRRSLDPSSTLTAGDVVLKAGTDFVAVGGRGGTGGGAGGATAPVTVFIASDSTASTYSLTLANKQAGWGQFLADYFTTQVKVSNQAIGGRTSRRFINEGRLTTILNAMKPGDYLMVQFGTNDGNTTATYDDGEPYLVSTTDFQMYMNMYVDGVRGKQGIPILVTPPPRATCTGDSHTFGNGLAGYSMAMKTVAAAKDVALIDLNAATLDYVQMIGCVAAKADFYLVGDGTHFQQNGARLMAGFVADGVVALSLPLAAYRLP